MRRLGARSLLSGRPVSTEEAAHGVLFSRRDIETARHTRLASGQLLSNVVLLDHEDAGEWKRLRETGTDLMGLYELCQERTAEADDIWKSQAVSPRPDEALEDALRDRSRELLAELGITETSG